jgi:hypothetical protein
MPRRFWRGGIKKRGDTEDIGIEVRTILKCMLKKWDGRAQTGFIWLRIGTSGRRF